MTRVSFLMRTRLKNGIVRRNAKYLDETVVRAQPKKPDDGDDGGGDDGGGDDDADDEEEDSNSSDDDILDRLRIIQNQIGVQIRLLQNTAEGLQNTVEGLIKRVRRRRAKSASRYTEEDVELPSVEIVSDPHFGTFKATVATKKKEKNSVFSGKGYTLGTGTRQTGPRFTDKKSHGGKLPLEKNRPMAAAAGPGFETPSRDVKRVFIAGSWVEIPDLKVIPDNKISGKKHATLAEKTQKVLRMAGRSCSTDDVFRAAGLPMETSSSHVEESAEPSSALDETLLPESQEPC